jgi:hypothetical protein
VFKIILGIFEILLMMPPYLFWNFIKIQIFVVNILMCELENMTQKKKNTEQSSCARG